jgi:hypothetical protein
MGVKTSKKYLILIWIQEKNLKKNRREYKNDKGLQPPKAVKCETSPRFSLAENG